MVIKTNCVVCDCEVTKPKIGQLTCNSVECVEEYNKNQQACWRNENPDRVRKINREAYHRRKGQIPPEEIE